MLNKKQWIEVLQSELTNKLDLEIFQTMYVFENHAAASSQIGRTLGYSGKTPQIRVNSEIGRYGKRISKVYDLTLSIRESNQQVKYWDIFFNGWDAPSGLFIWQLKAELIEALEELEFVGIAQIPEEILADEILTEGIKKTIIVNRYERNSKARRECIEYWKAICSVCAFDFYKTYGELGKGFIEVHHIIPISTIGQSYKIDPINDLRPVCPNCHAMLHRNRKNVLTIAALKSIVNL